MPDLTPGYRYERMSRAELQPLIEPLTPSVFAGTGHLSAGYAYAEAEQKALRRLEDNLAARLVLAVGVFQGDACVGWHIGNQVDRSNFEMASSGISPEHRRRGLYSALIPVVLEYAQNGGFQAVVSRHNLTNNAVIIPKLKAGFVISGFSVSDRFGTLVKLSYFFNPLRRKVFDVRVGQLGLDSDTRKIF